MHDVESPGLVEAIVRTIREPLLILDEQLNVRAASPAFYRAFHANAADTVGHALFELGDGQWDIAALRELLEVILPLEASAEDFEVALDSPHLGRRFMVLNARRLEGKAERLILLAIQDVTERGVRNKELERSKQAEKMEAVGRLAAGVAHDLNNLLTAIEGHASILLAEIPEDDRLRDDVEEIRSAGRRAANLTWQLLAFSRKQKLEERRIDLVRAARELQSMLVRLVPERIDFRIEAGTGEIVVRADPSQLQQVLMNLVVNAVDAIDEAGSITVSIDAKDVTSAGAEEIPWDIEVGPYARVTVRDTGHGMDPEVLSRIFEPFFTTRAEGHGTGLGLAMVYGVVKQSGGHVLGAGGRRSRCFCLDWPARR
jgi:signal transduction histidine kinase